MTATGGPMKKSGEKKPGFSLSLRRCIEHFKKEYTDVLAEFESIVNGVEIFAGARRDGAGANDPR